MKPDTALPGIINLLGLAAIIIAIMLLSSCAEMPLTLSIYSDYGKASYSAKGGIEISIQK